ncbi:GNAT family N-acetyltransferase [Actinophytocola sp. NPDC049390]|uniref:GNAT family N-acetyltransferase n=1 Tax=Actinophytocola sp. NPDC049390 TaxID=3363894 RepID=UPI00379F2C6F
MNVRLAEERDLAGFLGLAAQVEHWFGPMVDDPGFRAVVAKNIRRATALVAADPDTGLAGGLLFSPKPPVFRINWLVVDEASRGGGVGRALLTDAFRRFVHGPGVIEVITFGADHPGATASNARAFYQALGFVPAEPADPGPEGGSRQVFRRPAP